jgi:hypothetical protein
MSNEKVIYKSGMWPFEIKSLIYELPMILIVIGVPGAVYLLFRYYIFPNYEIDPRTIFFTLAGVYTTAIIFIFWAATFYPRQVIVFEDRIRIKMLLGKKDVKIDDIEDIRKLDPKETGKTLLSQKTWNLSPAINGAVLLKRKKGKDWVFSPADPQEFLFVVVKMVQTED